VIVLLQALVVKPDGSSVAAGGGVVSVSIPIKQFIHCLEKQNAAYNLSFTFLDDFFPVISGPGHVLRGLRRLWTPILCFGAKKKLRWTESHWSQNERSFIAGQAHYKIPRYGWALARRNEFCRDR